MSIIRPPDNAPAPTIEKNNPAPIVHRTLIPISEGKFLVISFSQSEVDPKMVQDSINNGNNALTKKSLDGKKVVLIHPVSAEIVTKDQLQKLSQRKRDPLQEARERNKPWYKKCTDSAKRVGKNCIKRFPENFILSVIFESVFSPTAGFFNLLGYVLKSTLLSSVGTNTLRELYSKTGLKNSKIATTVQPTLEAAIRGLSLYWAKGGSAQFDQLKQDATDKFSADSEILEECMPKNCEAYDPAKSSTENFTNCAETCPKELNNYRYSFSNAQYFKNAQHPIVNTVLKPVLLTGLMTSAQKLLIPQVNKLTEDL